MDVHMEEVVRLHEQVRCVLDIEEHRGCSGAVLEPEDDKSNDNNIETGANRPPASNQPCVSVNCTGNG